MPTVLEQLLRISVLIFMVGNLSGMGLEITLREAVRALRNVRFVLLTVVWSWVLCPALGYLLATVVPLAKPYATGLMLISMVPCAPFMPGLVKRARGDLAYAAAFMLITAVGTIVFLPLAVPRMVEGLSVDTWSIAKPLLLFILLPLAIGLAIRDTSSTVAARLGPVLKRITGVATIVLLVLVAILYGKGFVGAVGSYAIGTQLLFLILVAWGSAVSSRALGRARASVVSLGLCTRNLGAAMAIVVTVPDADPRVMVMVALSLPLMALVGLVAAGRSASGGTEAVPVA